MNWGRVQYFTDKRQTRGDGGGGGGEVQGSVFLLHLDGSCEEAKGTKSNQTLYLIFIELVEEAKEEESVLIQGITHILKTRRRENLSEHNSSEFTRSFWGSLAQQGNNFMGEKEGNGAASVTIFGQGEGNEPQFSLLVSLREVVASLQSRRFAIIRGRNTPFVLGQKEK